MLTLVRRYRVDEYEEGKTTATKKRIKRVSEKMNERKEEYEGGREGGRKVGREGEKCAVWHCSSPAISL